jgi:hypothetical protein
MKFVLLSIALLFSHGALAEGGGMTSSGSSQSGARTEAPKADNVPTGGCMPIGLTARGELVFPMQCREILDRERGPAPDDVTLRAPQNVQPLVQQDVAAPEQAHLGVPAGNLSAVRRHRNHPPQAAMNVIGRATKKP